MTSNFREYGISKFRISPRNKVVQVMGTSKRTPDSRGGGGGGGWAILKMFK